jgi:hypothetical protein
MTHPDCEGCRKALEKLAGGAKEVMAVRGTDWERSNLPAYMERPFAVLADLVKMADALLASPPAPCEGCGKTVALLANAANALENFHRSIACICGVEERCGLAKSIDLLRGEESLSLSPAPAKPFETKVEVDPTLKPGEWYLKAAKPCAEVTLTDREREAMEYAVEAQKAIDDFNDFQEDRHIAVLAALVRRLMGQGETE